MAGRSLALRPAAAVVRRPSWRAFALLPLVALYGALLVVPLALVVSRSLEGGTGGYGQVVDDPLFRRTVGNTLMISATTTAIAVLVGAVLAIALWRARPVARAVLLGVVLLPFWTSVLVKNFAWSVLLNDNGLVNDALRGLGLTHAPVTLLHNRFAVIVGMVHYVVPYAVFPIYAALLAINPGLEQAATSLGASRAQAFRHVLLPLMRPGLYAAALLVFIISAGFFITPVLLGGPGDAMIANQVDYYARELVDFRAAAVVGVFVTAAASLLIALYQRLPKEAQHGAG